MKPLNKKQKTVSKTFGALVFSFLLLVSFAVSVFPSSVYAVSFSSTYCGGGSSLDLGSDSSATTDTVIKGVTCLLQQSVIPFLFALAGAVFVWGMVKFISTQEAAEKEKGRQFMLWGVIALTVMFCVWGLVKVLNSTFSVSNVIPQLPQ